MSAGAITGASVLGGLSGGIGITAAEEQNKAIDESVDSAFESAVTQRRQLSVQAGSALLKRRQEASRLRGIARSSAAERNIGTGGSAAADVLRVQIDQSLNEDQIRTDLANKNALVASQFKARVIQLESGRQNPIIAGLIAGIQGAATGLAIGGAAQSALTFGGGGGGGAGGVVTQESVGGGFGG